MSKKYIVHNIDYGVDKVYDNVKAVNVSCILCDCRCWVETIDDTEKTIKTPIDIGNATLDECFNLPNETPDTYSDKEEFEQWRDSGNQFWVALVSVIIFLIFIISSACIVEIVCRYIW